jgi:hypothetical protein
MIGSIVEEIYNFSSLGPSGDQCLVVLIDSLANRRNKNKHG